MRIIIELDSNGSTPRITTSADALTSGGTGQALDAGAATSAGSHDVADAGGSASAGGARAADDHGSQGAIDQGAPAADPGASAPPASRKSGGDKRPSA